MITLKGKILKGSIFETGDRQFQILLPSRMKFKDYDKEIYAQFNVIGKNYILYNYIEV